MPDTLPLDSDVIIEVDDTSFAIKESLTSLITKSKVCGTLPLDSDIVIEYDG